MNKKIKKYLKARDAHVRADAKSLIGLSLGVGDRQQPSVHELARARVLAFDKVAPGVIDVDAASDVFALGPKLWFSELIVGLDGSRRQGVGIPSDIENHYIWFPMLLDEYSGRFHEALEAWKQGKRPTRYPIAGLPIAKAPRNGQTRAV